MAIYQHILSSSPTLQRSPSTDSRTSPLTPYTALLLLSQKGMEITSHASSRASLSPNLTATTHPGASGEHPSASSAAAMISKIHPNSTSPTKPLVTPKRGADGRTKPAPNLCLGCHQSQTPQWRQGPLGPRTLCNACVSSRHAKQIVQLFLPHLTCH